MTKPTRLQNTFGKTRGPLLVLALSGSAFLTSTSLFATEDAGDAINWAHMAMGLFGGLALFLFGMEQMSDARKSALVSQNIVLSPPNTKQR